MNRTLSRKAGIPASPDQKKSEKSRVPAGPKSRKAAESGAQRPAGSQDYSLLFILFFLLAFGLVLLYSTSSYIGIVEYGGDSAYFLRRQLLFTGAGLGLMAIVALIPYRWWRFLAIPAFFASIGLIVLVTLYGREVNGAKRWLDVGPITLQPSEAAKVAIVICTAFLIETIGRRRLLTLGGFFLPVIPSGILAILLFVLTNNMSAAIILLAISFGMLFVACPAYKRFIVLAVLAVLACVAVVMLTVWSNKTGIEIPVIGGFRLKRVLVWLDLQAYADEGGFQTIQALYAIGSGGIFGKGLGQSMQKLVVPEAQNDMIFSIICEELGLFGAIAIMLLFVLLLWRLILVAGGATDLYGALIVTGVVTHIAVQVFINIAVVTNTIPNTGVTLPFISYGGSSLFFLLAEIGMVLSVSRANNKAAMEREEAGQD